MNTKRAVDLTAEAGLDALVGATSENAAYLSGFGSYTQLHLKNKVFALLRMDEPRKPALVVPLVDTGALALSDSPPDDVVFYGRFFISSVDAKRSSADKRALRYISAKWPAAEPTAVKALTDAIVEKGLSRGKIGVDEEGMTFETFSYLREFLPNARLVGASQLLKKIRMVKTEEEISLLRASAGFAESAIEAGLDSVGEGTTERSLSEVIEVELTRHAEPGIVNAYGGRNSAYVLRRHLGKKIGKGDQIWLDVGCYHKGYCSDTGITAVRGRPSEKLKRYHEAVVSGQRKAIEAVKAGTKPSQLHKIAIAEVRKTIPEFSRDQVGHGLGLEHYEPPGLGAHEETPLEEGMVINVETPYYEIGFGGLMVEDTVLVKKEGCEFLTRLEKDLRVVA